MSIEIKGPSQNPESLLPVLPQTRLTTRQLEVLYLLSKGYTRKEAANSLGISPYTLKNHSASIIQELGAESILEAILIAGSSGIINIENATEGLDPSRIKSLTSKELQIMRELTDDGPTNKEIAARLGLKEQTVKNYLKLITKKLGVNGSRIRAAMLYIAADRKGLVPFSPPH